MGERKKRRYSTAELHRRFAEGLAKGMTQTQAYIDAGYATENMSRKTLYVKASEVAKLPEVLKMREEIEKDIQNNRSKALAWSRDKAALNLLRILKELWAEAEENGLTSKIVNGILGTIDRLNKLDGVDAADKIRIKLLEAELAEMKMAEEGNARVSIIDDMG